MPAVQPPGPRLAAVALVALAASLACGGSVGYGEPEVTVMQDFGSPVARAQQVALLYPAKVRGGYSVGCENAEIPLVPELRRHEPGRGYASEIRLWVDGDRVPPNRPLYQSGLVYPTAEEARAAVLEQRFQSCLSPDGRRLAIRWIMPGGDEGEAWNPFSWMVAELGAEPRWLPDAPPELSCLEAAAR